MSIVQQKYAYAFRLKSGSHHDFQRKITLEVGQVLETNEDMVKLHGADRWEPVHEGEDNIEQLKAKIRALESRLPPETDELESKSPKELRAMAAEMSPPVDLSSCNGKAEIIAAIRQALDAA